MSDAAADALTRAQRRAEATDSKARELAFLARVEAALGPTLTREKLEWREMCGYWGPFHPASTGCLLAVVCKAFEGTLHRAVVDVQDLPDREDPDERWEVDIMRWSDAARAYEPDFNHTLHGPTANDALLAALEAGR